LDFSKIFLLSLDRIEGGILEISACLLLDNFLDEALLEGLVEMHYLKNLLLLLVVSWFQPAL